MKKVSPTEFLDHLSANKEPLVFLGAARRRDERGEADSIEFTFDGDYEGWVRIPTAFIHAVHQIGAATMHGERVERVRLEVLPTSDEARQLLQIILAFPIVREQQSRLRNQKRLDPVLEDIEYGHVCRATVECTGGEWEGGSFGGKGKDDWDDSRDKAIDRAVKEAARKCDDFSPEFTFEERDIDCRRVSRHTPIHG